MPSSIKKECYFYVLLSLVSAGHFGHFQSSSNNAYSSASASAYRFTHSGGAHIPILRYEHVNNGVGTYKYSYETGNGIAAHKTGSRHAPGPEGRSLTAEGGFSYTAPDGQQVSLSYTADERGYHPVGSRIPTPPSISEAILRSIEYNRQHPSFEAIAYNGGGYQHGYNY